MLKLFYDLVHIIRALKIISLVIIINNGELENNTMNSDLYNIVHGKCLSEYAVYNVCYNIQYWKYT